MGAAVHDVLSVATVTKPEIWEVRDIYVEVETEGILKEVAKSEDVELLHIEFLGSFIDKYGNTGIDTLAWYEFSRETIEKINFTNFNPKNIGLIADSYFEHPAFQKK